MKRKGFTIIELVAVMTLLAIILAITTPIITGVIRSAKEKACVLDAGMLEKAAKTYIDIEGIAIKQGQTIVVPLSLLQAENYISPIYSPEDRTTACEGYVNVGNQGGTYQYAAYLKCQKVCETAGYDGNLENAKLEDSLDVQDKNGAKYFVGANPNNWVKFGRVDQSDTAGLLWRIIKIDDVGIKMVYEGRENGGVQPVENGRVVIDATTGIAWDSAGGNKWEAPASLKPKLSNWFNSIVVTRIEDYATAVNWKVGGVPYNDPTSLSTFLQYEEIDSANLGGNFKGSTSDKTMVGLSNASDFISTSSNLSCVGSYREVGSGNECAFDTDGSLNNFLFKNKYHWWTMNARSDLTNKSWIINNAGQIATALSNSSIVSTRPVVNIKKDIIFYAGNGTIEDPYILEEYMVGIADRPIITLNGVTPYVMKEGDSYIEEKATAIDEKDGDISSLIQITSDLNVNLPGTYSVIYNVTDSDGNKALPIIREVIVAPKTSPILNLKGATPMYITLNHAYVEPGATAYDLNDGDISSSIVITGSVDTSQLGVYEIKYNVTNSQGKSAVQIIRKVIVEVPKPALTMNGSANVLIEIGDTYIEEGATAIDEIDGDITNKIIRKIYSNNQEVASINGAALGNYVVKYQVVNSLGGTSTISRSVAVVSATGPAVTFNPDGDDLPKQLNSTVVTVNKNRYPVVSESVKYLWVGSRWSPSGRMSLEDAINIPFVSGDTVNSPKGTDYYYVYVVAKDTYDDVTIKKSKPFLIDNSKPVITLRGSSVVNMLIDSIYTEQGATAYDKYFDGDLSSEIEITSDVNPSVEGTYFVTYTVSDRAGNITVTKRRVNVNYSVPRIKLNGASDIDLRIGTPYEELGATATDSIDGDLTDSIIADGWVDETTAGTYDIVYSVTNSFGVETTSTRTVRVYVPKPVITILGKNPYSMLINDWYSDDGAEAMDEVDGDLTGAIEVTDDVNPSVVGTYYITYSVTNSYGGTSIARRTVNVKYPVTTITLEGSNPYVMDVGEMYSEPGYTAIDELDGDISSYVETTTNLNPNVVGTYRVTYTVTNSMNIIKSIIRTVSVIPLQGPVISIVPNGNTAYKQSHSVVVSVAANKKPVDEASLKYLWSDSTFKPLASAFVETFNNNAQVTSPSGITGKYYLYILAVDTEGNTSILRSNAYYLDNTAPLITLKGSTVIEVPVNGVYTEQGATVKEDHSGLNSNGLIVTGTVIPGILGTYTVTYDATDKAGNMAVQVKRTVVVRELTLGDELNNAEQYVPKYFADYFVGANPNNWIEFGTVTRFDDRPLLWRIVKSDIEGIKIIYEGVKNGTSLPLEDGRIGLESSMSHPYDISNINKWDAPASLAAKLQTWYTNLYEPDKATLVNPINWCIGGISGLYTIDDFKIGECLDQTTVGGTFIGRTTIKTGIGLLNSADYLLTSAETCNAYNQSVCGINNYLSRPYNYLTINADAATATNVFEVKSTGGLSIVNANTLSSIRPVINLKSNVLVLSGEGTIQLPYKLNNRVPIPDAEAPIITFTPSGGPTYSASYSVEVVASDTLTGIQEGTLKYVWTTSSTAPAESEIVNIFTNGDSISTPPGVSGTYYLWVTARDNKNNLAITGSGAFKLDVTLPVITINGSNPYILEQGGIYLDEGATAYDSIDGNIAVAMSSNVNPSVVGTYTVTYTATDSAGNTTTAQRTVSVEIPTPLATKISPYLTSKQGSNYFVGVDPNNWIEFGQVSSTDATPLLWRIIKSDTTGIRVVYEGKKNGINVPIENGKLITNKRWDGTNNKWERPAEARTYIENWFNNTFYLANKEIYVEPINWCIGGVTSPYAIDQECITIGAFPGKTSAMVSVGLINPSDYIATSSSTSCTNGQTTCGTEGNFLYKPSYYYWSVNGLSTTGNDVWTIASTGGFSTPSCDTSSTYYAMRPVVNIRKNVMSLRGSGTITNPYAVRPDSKPYIKILGDNPIELSQGGIYTDPGIMASDDKDGDITNRVSITGTINPSVSGTYTVTYNVTDSDGNSATPVTRTVKVLASTLLANKIAPDLISRNASNYFVGANPNNWLEFGQVSSVDNTPLLWRIIKSDAEGIKIIYEGKKVYGTPPIENGSLAANKIWGSSYNKWETMPTIRGYIETWFNSTFYDINKDILAAVTNWCIGASSDPYVVSQECINQTAAGGVFTGITSTMVPISLLRGSDYLSTSASASCTGVETTCGTDGNFLYKPAYSYWLVNALSTSAYKVWLVSSTGNLKNNYPDTTNSTTVDRPVVNIRANTITNKGDGTWNNPYMILPNAVPSIKLLGTNPISISIDSIYSDAGVLAVDDKDGNITSNVIVTSNLNTHVVGAYTITYNVTDSNGNAAPSVIRTINVVDDVPPTVTFGTNGSATYVNTGRTAVTVTDNPGVNTSSLKYQWTTSSTAPTEASFTTAFTNGSTISSQAGVTGGYYLWILAKDIAGNTTIVRSNLFNLDAIAPVITLLGNSQTSFAVGTIYVDAGATASDNIDGNITANIAVTSNLNPNVAGVYTVTFNVSDTAGNAAPSVTRTIVVTDTQADQYVASKGVNKPKLAPGMTPIKWDGSNWISTTETDDTWYDYTNKIWANARTVDGSMWVWIPRYAYILDTRWHTSIVGTIGVQFSIGVDDTRGNTVTLNDASGATASNMTYTKHPGFTFGTAELTGIWVAKFEASDNGAGNVAVVPSAASWRSQTVDTVFTLSRGMETKAIYGWGTTGNGIDTHLTKNVEWGAAAYLSKSIYGKYSVPIWPNPVRTYKTGCAGTSASTSSVTTCAYTYETANGLQASTTGNIYGLYDMAGSLYEYTAAYLDNGNVALSTEGNSLYTAAAKYKDVYSMGVTDTGINNYNATINKKGDAIYETSLTYNNNNSWDGDISVIPMTATPWMLRGGNYYLGGGAGIFGFGYSTATGSATSYVGFRPAIVVGPGL